MTPGQWKGVVQSSASVEWETPPALFEALREEFGPIHVDVCARLENRKAHIWYGPGSPYAEDGLGQNWEQAGRCWMNPPFGRQIWRWTMKARQTGERGGEVVAILPARVDTQWFHEDVQGHARVVRFLRGRVHYLKDGRDVGPSGFPSAVVVWGRRP